MKLKKFQATLSLKPTQFSIGLLEVEYKVTKLLSRSAKRLNQIIRETKIPVVISPDRQMYVIDHHHYLFACWHAGIKKVRVEVVKDYSNTGWSYRRFWQKMADKELAYLYDQFGQGPRQPLYLPTDVRGMADDPYRSLAWMVRKAGGYENSDETFCEFKWADLLRRKGLLDARGRSGLKNALKKAMALARSEEARGLPGFLGKKATKPTRAPKLVQAVTASKTPPPLVLEANSRHS